jgi:hypothetical protein
MKTSYWCPIDLFKRPLPPVVELVERSAEITDKIIEQFADEARYVKRDLDGKPGDETCCNFLAVDTCAAQGVTIPRDQSGLYLRANHLVREYLRHTPPWELVEPWIAHDLAKLGRIVIVGQENPTGPGHVARLKAPRPGEDPKGWFIGQAGGRNFTHGPMEWGFGKNPKGLVFAVHP